MSDDPRDALQRLVDFAAAEDPVEDDVFADPRWEDVAAGRASAATRAELEELARAAGYPDALDLFAPPAPGESARIVRAIGREDADDDEDETVVPLRATTPKGSDGTSRMVAGLLAAVALAALAVLWWSPSTERPGDPVPVAMATSYEATVHGGVRRFRDDTEPPRFGPGTTVEVALRPSERLAAPPAMRTMLRVGGEVRDLPGDVEVAEGGAMRFRTTLPEPLPSGELTLLLFLGPGEALPSTAEAGGKTPAGVQRIELRLEREPEP